MSHEPEQGETSNALAGFPPRVGGGRERSASPHTSSAGGVGLPGRTGDSGRSRTLGTNTTSAPVASQQIDRGIYLHPALVEALEKYQSGTWSYIRSGREGGAFIAALGNLTDFERDALYLEFTEAIDGTDRRREEERDRGGNREGGRRRVEGEEEEAGRSDWGEEGEGRIGARVGRRGGVLREDRCPWFKAKKEDPREVAAESRRKTRDIIQYLRDDVPTAVQWAQFAEGSPKHFPESEWNNIIRGRAVNLGKVLASRFISRPLPENVGTVGGIEVRFPGKERGRRIEGQSDWHNAWRATARATAFVFPHRERELTDYGDYVMEKFSRRSLAYQSQVITFDEAIRQTVGGGESRSLLDADILQEFSEVVLDSSGAEFRGEGKSGARKGQTSAGGAKKPITGSRRARKPSPMARGNRPKYLRYNRWDVEGGPIPGAADWSEQATPLPRPPKLNQNHVIAQTLRARANLFQIITPIKTHIFRKLLHAHPNQKFVKSVCDGFEGGFWPWAVIDMEGYPEVNDQAQAAAKSEATAAFLREQRDKEIEKGRFSAGFGGELLPGMYCMPIFAVPKSEPNTFRLVTHQSFGEHSLNSMTPPHERAFPMDNLTRLGDQLIRIRRECPAGQKVMLWKSDVSEAYRLLPVAPEWQIRQINTIEGKRHVDRCVAFGGRRSGDLFISFMSLVLWISQHERGVPHPNGFVDDTFSVQIGTELAFHAPLGKSIPVDQARMLRLWDDVGIPYKPHKQQHGSVLTILGIEVDADALTFTLPQEKKDELVAEMDKFIFSPGLRSNRFSMRELQTLAGWFNWALNVFPLLRPGLCNVYARMREKGKSKARMRATRAMSDDLSWAKEHIQRSNGIFLLIDLDWKVDDTGVMTIYTDACLSGMGVFIPDFNLGLWHTMEAKLESEWIYYRELWAVVSALHYCVKVLDLWQDRLVIYTDNTNCVDAFNTLAVDPLYNPMLRFAVDLLLGSYCQLRVLHIPGAENNIADALSRKDLGRAASLEPGLNIQYFEPPRDALGAIRK